MLPRFYSASYTVENNTLSIWLSEVHVLAVQYQNAANMQITHRDWHEDMDGETT